MPDFSEYVRFFDTLTNDDVGLVGGKNASLGEMIRELDRQGVRVPGGFATTAKAYREFLRENDLEGTIRGELDAYASGDQPLSKTGKAIRDAIKAQDVTFPEAIREAILDAYAQLSERYELDNLHVAARSSATAEDLPEASFAGQQETYLNVAGDETLLEACQNCYASLFTDRAISYRDEKGFDHLEVALSVGVQKMVRSDKSCAGVLFTIDTDSGFPDAIVIDGNWGLGETVVQGSVNPDQFTVYKPFLDDDNLRPIIGKERGSKEHKLIYGNGGSAATQMVETNEEERHSYVLEDDEIVGLARWAKIIEDHYGRAMDIEWGKDGETGELFILQARPETVHSQREPSSMHAYTLQERGAEPVLTGLAIGSAIATGEVSSHHTLDEIEEFEDGDILVTEMTDPDWVPIMKKAAAIITNAGGRTSHAAIVSRELGIPAVIGTGNATDVFEDDQMITVDCASSDEGRIYDGELQFEERRLNLEDVPKVDTRIMLNIASPAASMRWWKLPCDGIGLARMEYIINNVIKAHPMALVRFDEVEDGEDRDRIEELTAGFDDKEEYFVDHLARGIATIAASQYPAPVIVRTSDFKTNEYAELVGGKTFEPRESNPMLGWRGASRYYSEGYREGFALECRALKRVREEMGFDNVVIMLPFVRTLQEADRCLDVMAQEGLERGENGLKVYMMAEIPSNVVLADRFADRFDGFSIGTNDLTQLILGVDRDAAQLAYLFDERDEAVKRTVANLITAAHGRGRSVGICGQAPSDYPDFAAFLVENGIDSISLNPDSVIPVIERIAELEG